MLRDSIIGMWKTLYLKDGIVDLIIKLTAVNENMYVLKKYQFFSLNQLNPHFDLDYGHHYIFPVMLIYSSTNLTNYI